MSIDFLTSTYTDVDGRIHVATPMSYMRMLSGIQDGRENEAAIMSDLMSQAGDRVEIQKKYLDVTKQTGEPAIKPEGSGKRKSKATAGIPKFYFDPGTISRKRK